MGINYTELNYTERRLLQAYYYFFGKKFSFDDSQSIVAMQNMAYFLQKKNWLRTEFEFSLISEGMYSSGLEAVLREMKRKQGFVDTYQSECIEEISLRDWKRLNQISDLFLIDEYDEKTDWIMGLACVLYVLITLLPNYQSFPVICKRIRRDVNLPDALLRNAWGCIK